MLNQNKIHLLKIMLVENVVTFSNIFFPKSDLKTVNNHVIFMCMSLFTLTKIINIQIVFNIF